MTHSPTPWHIGYWTGQCHIKHLHGNGGCKYDYSIHSDTEWSDSCICAGNKNNPITIINGKEEQEPFDVANVKFIVKAVNMHEELIKVCQWSLACMKDENTSLKTELEKLVKKASE